MYKQIFEVTPTISTSQYTAGDQVGGVQAVKGACEENRPTYLNSVTIVDKDSEGADCSILFFDREPTVSSNDNEALNISDVEMADKCLGVVSVAAGDFKTASATKIATVKPNLVVASKAGGNLWAVVVAGGTPTYTATNDLVFKYSFADA